MIQDSRHGTIEITLVLTESFKHNIGLHDLLLDPLDLAACHFTQVSQNVLGCLRLKA